MNPLAKLVIHYLSHLSVMISTLACDPGLSDSEEMRLTEEREESTQLQEDLTARSATSETLRAIFLAPQGEVEDALNARCERCPSSQSCERPPEDEALTLSEATCLIAESSDRELDAFIDYQRCVLTATRAFSACIDRVTSCDDSALETCSSQLSMSASQCELSSMYRDRVGIVCFGERPDFVCDNGQTIEGEWVCDGEPDCADRSDEEQGCSGR